MTWDHKVGQQNGTPTWAKDMGQQHGTTTWYKDMGQRNGTLDSDRFALDDVKPTRWTMENQN